MINIKLHNWLMDEPLIHLYHIFKRFCMYPW